METAPEKTDEHIPEDVVERFGISGFRTEKFRNDAEDSSLIDQCSDSPSVMDAFEVFASMGEKNDR